MGDVIIRETTPATLLNLAIEQGKDIDKLEKLMELQTVWEANQARKAYFEAVANFHKSPPKVMKDLENVQFSKGNKKAMYASLGNLVGTVSAALGEHGLSASWDINQTEKTIKVSCKLSHRQGHSESVSLESAPDASGAKSPIQQIKSTVTYLRAVTFEAVTGIAATNEANLDDDGAGETYITDEQKGTIVDYLAATGSDVPTFLKYMSCETVDKITAKDYTKAISALKAKEKQGKAK